MKILPTLITVAWLSLCVLPATAADRTLAEWSFNQNGDRQSWTPSQQLEEVVVTNGVLTCRATGSDPILLFAGPLELKTSPWQLIEIRLKANRAGTADFFWSNTTEGRYGGFTEQKRTSFAVTGDSQWHTYRIVPFWHPEGKIIRLRFDPYDQATYAIDFIRILEVNRPPAVSRPVFDFSQTTHNWQPVNGAESAPGNGLSLTFPHSGSFLFSPPLQIQADRQNYVSLRLAAEQGERLTLLYATEATQGWHSLTFPVQTDGRDRTYTLDLQPEENWRGKVIALALSPGDASSAKVRLRQLSVSDEPQGEPQLKLTAFTLEDTLPRAGRPATLTAVIANTGGGTVTNLQARLTLPNNVRLLSPSPTHTRKRELAFGETVTWQWQIQCDQPLQATAQVSLVSDNSQPVIGQAPLHLTAQPKLPKADYVPEPKPVRGPGEVGVYYFPGWNSIDRWQKIQPFPERKPALGWYREGDPEVADWHIKWAVEHGITYFAYDWYWSKGVRHLEHGLHDGYFKARYRHLLKFCLLWANHNPPQTSSPEDCLAVTRFWITNYFQRPEHLTIDGKPLVLIFSPHRLTEDLGRAGVKPALESMRAECRKAGLKGLYLLACVSSATEAQQAGAEGYDAVTAYNWPGLGRTGMGNYAPFATLVDGYRQNWERILQKTLVPLLLPISGGWDSRPWHGDKNLVRFDRSPELFKRHLLDAKRLLQTANPQSLLPNHMLIEAWNEWGEGSYIEPHSQFGFGYLDAIREVFTTAPPAHTDLTPADVGLGPYDLPPAEPPRTTWDFDQGNQGWHSTMHLQAVSVTNGALTGISTGPDPAFFGPHLRLPAGDWASVSLRMKLQAQGGQAFRDLAQLFWRTQREGESEATSARFEVFADDQWHDYQVPVAQNPHWRGALTQLRLDPCNRPGVAIAVDYLRLVPSQTARQ